MFTNFINEALVLYSGLEPETLNKIIVVAEGLEPTCTNYPFFKYVIAFSNMEILSLAIPNKVLHLPHNNPLTTPVL